MLLVMSHGVHMDHFLLILRKLPEISNYDHLPTCYILLRFWTLHRNYKNMLLPYFSHEYQLIMVVIWKRLSDTGKNWRHVYKVNNIIVLLA